MNSFTNRLKKNVKQLSVWAERFPCTAYRIYDRDIPEYAVSIDFYAGKFVVYRYFNAVLQERDERHFVDVIEGLKTVFAARDEEIYIKERQRKKGLSQYEKVAQKTALHVVTEGQLKFIVNLSDYLDTGLFLDHRLSRRWVAERASGLRVLNLFCYTGTVSAHAIHAGARQVISVDMSQTYLDWASENFKLNGFSPVQHPLIRADVLAWLTEPVQGDFYDLIFLDPPSFSNSKKMKGTFDVQRDHLWLVEQCMKRLRPDGTLFFSNNLRSFKMAEEIINSYSVTDISKKTLPPDFRNELIHRAWLIQRKKDV
ncbi:hypothetical protein EBU99_00780 [bacterium]|nr:hypothetical protein [bacterium]